MKKVLAAAALGAVVLSGAAYADGHANNVNGWYVQGETGYVNQSGLGKLGTINADHSHWGYRGAVGYAFDMGNGFSLGPELGAGYYGHTDYKDSGVDLKYKSYAVEALAVGSYAFDQQFNVFAKAGMAYNDLRLSGTHSTYDTNGHEVDPMAAIGLGYNFMQNLGVTLTYSHIFGKSTHNTDAKFTAPEIDSVMAGVKFSF